MLSTTEVISEQQHGFPPYVMFPLTVLTKTEGAALCAVWQGSYIVHFWCTWPQVFYSRSHSQHLLTHSHYNECIGSSTGFSLLPKHTLAYSLYGDECFWWLVTEGWQQGKSTSGHITQRMLKLTLPGGRKRGRVFECKGTNRGQMWRKMMLMMELDGGRWSNMATP